MTIVKRTIIFAILFFCSLFCFPILGFAVAATGIPELGNLLFFWPQLAVFPNGFMDNDLGQSRAFFMNSAIFGAGAFWFMFAGCYGYILRDVKISNVALLTLPVATLVVVAFNFAIYAFGFSVYLDGP